ncbi:hypothetical protein [Christiangramia aquimixticola]|uniref:hypothetical protein n=1 Tax=Christiangramia aquimixticola TaxID=1697558 RepID=UPI003AA84BAB
MTLAKKIIIGISTFIILIIVFVFWLFFEILNDNEDDKIYYGIEIPENMKFDKPIEYLSFKQIDSLHNLKVEQEKILVIGSGYSGYDFYMWHKPDDKGKLFIKAFELTQNIQLSEWKLSTRTENEITKLENNYKIYTGSTVIDEGTFENFYPVRFELWFKSNQSGKEKKMTEKNYVIDGWDR